MPGVVEAEQRRRNRHQQHHSRRRRKGGNRSGADGRKDGEVVVEGEKSSPPGSLNPVSNGGGSCGSTNNNNCHGSPGSVFSSGSGGVLPMASASASVARRSFGSEHDVLFPHLALHLAGRGRCGSSRRDPDPERRRLSFDINSQHTSKGAEADPEAGSKEEEEEERQEIIVLDPAKHSFSLALRECQNRRFRPEGVSSPTTARRQRKRRPVSLDLNNHMSDTSVSSPRSVAGGLKKSPAASARAKSGMFPSPGTPNYRHGNGVAAAYQKGWSSERVPLPTSAGRGFGSSAAFLPFGNGKALPSKWEDAEKWICSPVSGDGMRQPAAPPHHKRPKSKSGPLGTPGEIGGCYSSASPSLPGFDVGRVRSFTVNSPFTAGVLVADRGCCANSTGDRSEDNGACGGGGRSHSAQSDHGMVRSASAHGWSDLLTESSSSLPSSQDEKHEGAKDGATIISSVILKKDKSTQMSPEESTHPSTKGWPQPSSSPRSSHTIGELHGHFSKLEVRDVQIDDQVTVTRWSKKHIARGSDKSSAKTTQWKKKNVESASLVWEISETEKCPSRSKREEAKITAWENLQKAKAEAAIQKLEMKLEKKRSSSMDKILKKLRSAQRKAQDMRNAETANRKQNAAVSRKALVFRKTSQLGGYLSGCFTCHVF